MNLPTADETRRLIASCRLQGMTIETPAEKTKRQIALDLHDRKMRNAEASSRRLKEFWERKRLVEGQHGPDFSGGLTA